MCFRSGEFVDFCNDYGINFSYSSPYHPRGNGQEKSSNKILMKIIKRIIGMNKKAWDSKLKLVVWTDRVTIKKATGKSPFQLVYRVEVKMHVNNSY